MNLLIRICLVDGFTPGTLGMIGMIGTIGTLAHWLVGSRSPAEDRPWVEDLRGTCEGLRGPGCRCITPFNAKNLGIISKDRGERGGKSSDLFLLPAFLFRVWPDNACLCHKSGISYSHSYL